MNDELEDVICEKLTEMGIRWDATLTSKRIAAAIRERFKVIPHNYDLLLPMPNPGPTPGEGYRESEKAIREKADAMEHEELKRAERGVDQDAIKMWREKHTRDTGPEGPFKAIADPGLDGPTPPWKSRRTK